MKNKPVATLFCVFGLLLIIGGLIGYLKAHSYISLIMGSAFGFGILIGSFLITRNNKIGIYLACSLTLVIDLVFLIRYLTSTALFPGAMSFLASIVLVSSYFLVKSESASK
ncbi:MAG: TMEM14 family protein [Chlamydiales bacterium]|nr:TMEM14 family protein [Chlamydiales bacterium]